jgi:hypothetical protein
MPEITQGGGVCYIWYQTVKGPSAKKFPELQQAVSVADPLSGAALAHSGF